jgi:Glycosyl transferase family 2
MRVIALLATYNEERFIAGCIEHLSRQGVEVYLIDNDSTDQTVAIAGRYLNRGLVGVETLPREGAFSLRAILNRKEEIAAALDADWFMHVDADEIRLPPRSDRTLALALAEAEAQGYNAVNFQEFTFVPTAESPDHDHPRFQETMRWYYPFLPSFPHRLNAWKRQPARVELAWSAGHRVRFPGLRVYPESFPLRHYLFLSVPHAVRKYADRRHDPAALAMGWHGWRERLKPEMVRLPSQAELRIYISDDQLDPSGPRTQHYVAESAIEHKTRMIPQKGRAAFRRLQSLSRRFARRFDLSNRDWRPPETGKPRVMYIVGAFPQISQTYIRSEIEALQGEYEISVIALSEPNVPYQGCVPFRRMADPAMIREAIEEFRPHVLHGHYLNRSEIFEALIRREGLNVPFTIRAHSFDTLAKGSGFAARAASVVNNDLCLGVLSFPFTRPLLEKAGIRPEKIHDCYPVVNYRRFHDRSPNGEAVMNVGAAIPKKRMEDFIELAAQFPGMEFNLYAVGHTVDELARCNKAKGGVVNIMPPIEPDEMPREYKKHRWLVYTASREIGTVGWPMAIAEAQAAGVGVCVANLRPDLRDYVGGGGFIYESIGEVADIITKPVPDEMREIGFEQARKSDIFEHKVILTDLWQKTESMRARSTSFGEGKE